ncbi:MAG: TIGR03016 family PEP-CTERM system-associated outer membrane protein [Methylococcales bacterium]|nr:TIGR03016 family PEP-CTERM system-associated outer membrane protein [Methylococcales bacterium]
MRSQSKTPVRIHHCKLLSVRLAFRLIITMANLCIVFLSHQAHAISWTITKTIQAQEIYSDNIALAPSGSQQGAFVEAINPGFLISGKSPLSTMNLNYRMQNLYNAGGNNSLNIYNQLQSSSRSTFIPNTLFLNSTSSISQQNINNNLIGASNLNGSSNSSNVYTFGLAPIWTPHISNYANGTFQVNANTIATSSNASSSSNSTLAPISNTFNLVETMGLNSGTYFQRVRWNLAFNNNESYVATGQNVSYQNSSARVSVPINAYFNVFTQGGYSNTSYQSSTRSANNGAYYTAGGQWQPSQRFSVTLGVGNNSFATVFISPMTRLTWTTTYSDNSVGTSFGQLSTTTSTANTTNTGTNTAATSGIGGSGNSGQNWQTALHYQAPRSTWSLTHINTTTTSQQILAQNQQLVNPVTNLGPNQFIINNPILTNNVIVSKAWNLSVSFKPGKSTVTLNAYDQDYTYLNSNGNKQKIIGVSGNWSWPFASKTSLYLRPTWQTISNQGSANSQYYMTLVGLNRAITPNLNGIVEFQHMNRSSSISTINQLIPITGYEENRVTATLSMRF